MAEPTDDLRNAHELRETTFARQVLCFDELGSTNDQALALSAEGGLPLPLLVLAGRQTAGRGRGGNQWYSSDGALTFSLLIDIADYPVFPAERLPLIALATGMAICRTLREQPAIQNRRIGVKWPNDVYAEGRKLCGILVETSSNRSGHVVIGVGLNVNNAFADAPAEVRGRAISLRDLTGTAWNRLDVLTMILHRLEEELDQIADPGFPLTLAWEQHCLLTGEPVTIRAADAVHSGMCCGIDDGGALLLDTGRGVQRFVSGVVLRFGTGDDG